MLGKIPFKLFFIMSLVFIDMFVGNLINSFLFKLKRYVEWDLDKPNLLNYLYFGIGLFNLIFFKRLIKEDPNNKYLISLVTFGIFVLNIFSFEPVTSLRVSAFFLIFMIYLFPFYINLVNKDFAKYAYFFLVAGLISLSYFYIWIYISSYNRGVLIKTSFVPYQFWLFHL